MTIDIFDRIILRIYGCLPDNSRIKNSQFLLNHVGKSATRQLNKTKQAVIKQKWEVVQLSNQLNELSKDQQK